MEPAFSVLKQIGLDESSPYKEGMYSLKTGRTISL
jgi:hypothetical protein